MASNREDVRRLRMNNNKSVIIGHFPFDFDVSNLTAPISLLKDRFTPPEDTASTVKAAKFIEAAEENAPWRLRDSSNEEGKRFCKTFVGTMEAAGADKYFLLIESRDGFTEVFPVENFYRFHGDTAARTSAINNSSESAEKEAKQNVIREADLSARVQCLRKRDSDDESTQKKKSKVMDTSLSLDDDYGIKRQELKRQKQVVKYKLGNVGKPNDYVNSALAVTTLRQNAASWDYDEGQRSDDEEDIFVDSQLDEDYAGDEAEKEEEDLENEDALTVYGQNVKNLLKQQANQEVDDELDQYLDEDEETEAVSAPETTSSVEEVKLSSVASAQGALRIQRHTNKLPVFTSSPSASVTSAASAASSSSTQKRIPTKEEVDAKIIRILTQNMGRMNVKHFMAQLKFKEKNEEFRLIQSSIQRLCTMEREEQDGQQVKYIALRPEFRH